MNLYSKQPKITIESKPVDKLLDVLAYIFFALLLGLTVYYYSKIPDQIPIHFGVDGSANNWASKHNLFFLVGLTGFLIFMLSAVGTVPHTFNYTVPITNENAKDQYSNQLRLLRWIKLMVSIFFTYIIYRIIQISLGNTTDFGIAAVIIFLTAVFICILFFYRRSKQFV